MVDLAKVMGLDVPAGAAGPTIVYKAADQSVNNSEVLVNDTHLVIPVGINEVWFLMIQLRTVDIHNDADIDYAFAVPAGGAISLIDKDDIDLVTTRAIDDGTIETRLNTIIGEQWTTFFATYTGGGNAGNLQFQWAQGVARVGNTRILENSFMLCHQIV